VTRRLLPALFVDIEGNKTAPLCLIGENHLTPYSTFHM